MKVRVSNCTAPHEEEEEEDAKLPHALTLTTDKAIVHDDIDIGYVLAFNLHALILATENHQTLFKSSLIDPLKFEEG